MDATEAERLAGLVGLTYLSVEGYKKLAQLLVNVIESERRTAQAEAESLRRMHQAELTGIDAVSERNPVLVESLKAHLREQHELEVGRLHQALERSQTIIEAQDMALREHLLQHKRDLARLREAVQEAQDALASRTGRDDRAPLEWPPDIAKETRAELIG